MASMKQRMLAGELYLAGDEELVSERAHAQSLLELYNDTRDAEGEERTRLLRDLLGEMGGGVVVRPTFRCDYGYNISIGAGTFVNFSCVMLDVVPIRIGAACQLATRVQFWPQRIRSIPNRGSSGGNAAARSRSATTSGSAAASSCVQ